MKYGQGIIEYGLSLLILSTMKKFFGRVLFSLATLTMLVISGCEENPQKVKEEFIRGSLEKINADSLKSYIQFLESMKTRFLLADNHRQVAVKIKQKFISFGYQNTVLDSFYLTFNYAGRTYDTWQYNVIATLCGKSFTDSVSIIGAHYDNYVKSGDPFDFVPGACDNASGVAAVFEIARQLHERSFTPLYTIRFVAFAGEEVGLHGSYDYVKKASENNEKIIMMLNNDMIANITASSTQSWKINIIDYSNSAGLRKEADRICTTYTSLLSYNDNTFSGSSDSYPFYLYGYKALFFIQPSLGDTYHTINDLSSACNFDYCREIVKISYALLLEKNYKYFLH